MLITPSPSETNGYSAEMHQLERRPAAAAVISQTLAFKSLQLQICSLRNFWEHCLRHLPYENRHTATHLNKQLENFQIRPELFMPVLWWLAPFQSFPILTFYDVSIMN